MVARPDLDLSLFDPLFSVLARRRPTGWTGEVKVRTGSRRPMQPRNVYQTSDGHWVCLGLDPGYAERVLVKIGRPELVKDPRFATNIERVNTARSSMPSSAASSPSDLD
jgi:formyl-CoA transferase